MNIVPQGDRVLVMKDAISDKSEGGIIIKPESDDSTTRTGIVKAYGTKIIKVGSRVLFNKYGGVPLKDDLLLLKIDEILAIVEDIEPDYKSNDVPTQIHKSTFVPEKKRSEELET